MRDSIFILALLGLFSLYAMVDPLDVRARHSIEAIDKAGATASPAAESGK